MKGVGDPVKHWDSPVPRAATPVERRAFLACKRDRQACKDPTQYYAKFCMIRVFAADGWHGCCLPRDHEGPCFATDGKTVFARWS